MSSPPENSGRAILLRPPTRRKHCVIIGPTVTAPRVGFLAKPLLRFLHVEVLCFAWGEVKAVGWSEIQARAIRENLSRFSERFFSAGNRPGSTGTYFLFTDNFFTMSSPATYIRSHSAPLVSADFPPAPGKSRPRGKFGRQCQLIFPPLHSTCLSPTGTQVNK